MDKFAEKLFLLDRDILNNWGNSWPEIGNVVRGLTDNCFAVIPDFEKSRKISFAYITSLKNAPGCCLQLEFKEPNFYDYLMLFALHISRENHELEMIGIYNTYIHSLRTFLETVGFLTITTDDINKNPNGTLISKNQIEIITVIDKVEFYRRALGSENYSNLIDGEDYVYIMMNYDDNTFKIGQSINPTYREYTLHSKQPAVKLLKAWECDKKIERELHKIYKSKRVRGEWFKLHFDDLRNLDSTIQTLINSNK